MKVQRRVYLKWIHWCLVPLVIWFTLVQPRDIRPFGEAAFMFHSALGLIFVSLALVWSIDYMRLGLAGRPGPKLNTVLKHLHQRLHKLLIWGLFFVALSGFLLGLTSSVLLWAGGIVPIAPPLGLPQANDLVGQIHAVEFYILAGMIAAHAAFHVWRHFKLRDNALRIMVPTALHKFL